MKKRAMRAEKPEAPSVEWCDTGRTVGYVDLIHAAANERQFILNFGQIDTLDRKKAHRVATIAMHPKTAGDLIALLAEQLFLYEQRFGVKILPPNMTFDAPQKESE